MKRNAAGAPPAKTACSVKLPARTKRLKFRNFTGEIELADAEHGKALVFVSHDDGHAPYFDPTDFGWEVA